MLIQRTLEQHVRKKKDKDALVHGEERMESVQPAGVDRPVRKLHGNCACTYFEMHAQVAGDRGARRLLGVRVGRSVLVSVTEACRVHEIECLRVVKKQIEYGPGVKDSHLIQVVVHLLECLHVRSQLCVEIVERGRDFLDRCRSLFDQKRRAVGWGNRKE